MKIESVEPVGDFNVLISFSDGSQRIFHGEKLWSIKKKFNPLKNIELFNMVQIYDCEHTICWPFGEDVHISPEWLHEWSTPI